MKTALAEPTEQYDRSDLRLSFTHEEVAKLNARTHRILQTQGATRLQRAYFRCPWPAALPVMERVATRAVDKWVGFMAKTGWTLVDKPFVDFAKRQPSHRMRGDWLSVPVPDEVEVPVMARFKKQDMRVLRTEVEVTEPGG